MGQQADQSHAGQADEQRRQQLRPEALEQVLQVEGVHQLPVGSPQLLADHQMVGPPAAAEKAEETAALNVLYVGAQSGTGCTAENQPALGIEHHEIPGALVAEGGGDALAVHLQSKPAGVGEAFVKASEDVQMGASRGVVHQPKFFADRDLLGLQSDQLVQQPAGQIAGLWPGAEQALHLQIAGAGNVEQVQLLVLQVVAHAQGQPDPPLVALRSTQLQVRLFLGGTAGAWGADMFPRVVDRRQAQAFQQGRAAGEECLGLGNGAAHVALPL